MSRHPRARRAPAAAAALALGVGACGSGGEGGDRAAAPECAPPAYESFGDSPKESAVAAARAGRFGLKGVRLAMRPPIDWDQDPISSTAFRGKLHDLTWLDPLLYGYLQGDRGALAQARDIALDWIEANPFADPYEGGRQRGGPKVWLDKVSAERSAVLAWLAAAAECEGLLAGAQRRAVRRSLATHGRFLAGSGHYQRTNHGLYVDQGLDLLARLAPALPGAERWARTARRRFAANLRSNLAGDEGFFLEHSATYQVAVTRLVERFLEFGAGGPGLGRLAARMRATAAWVLEPDSGQVLYGDSNLGEPTPEELDRARSAEGMLSLPRTGLAFVKRHEPGAYLAVFAGFHSHTHKDADELSFDLYDAGTRIVSDTGYYHNDVDEYLEFQDSPRAHSVLRVAPGERPIGAERPYGSGLEARGEADGWYAVLGSNPLLGRRGVEHQRLFLYRPGFALLVHDRVRSARTRTYERLFQLGPEVEVTEMRGGLRLRAPGLDGSLVSTADAPQRLRLVRGSEDPLAGLVFERFRRARPRYTTAFASEASNLEATAAFAIGAGSGLRAGLVRGRSGGARTTLALRSEAGRLGTISVRRSNRGLGLDVSDSLRGEPIG